jgi:hypothetical protein
MWGGQVGRFFRSRRGLAAFFFAAALALRAVVPSGFMLDVQNGVPVIRICPDQANLFVATADAASSGRTMPSADMAMDGMAMGDMGAQVTAPHDTDHSPNHSHNLGTCPYSVLALAPLDTGVIDLPAIIFALAILAMAIYRPIRLTATAFLRPPSRGPPLPT